MEIKMSRKKIMFDCPSCGNPLPASNKCDKITCHWCLQNIIPEGFGELKGQHAEIFADSEKYKNWLKENKGNYKNRRNRQKEAY